MSHSGRNGSAFHAARAYFLKARLNVAAAFYVDIHKACPRLRKELYLPRGVVHHKVYVKEHIRMLPHTLKHGRAVAYLLYKHAVHNVKVYPVNARSLTARGFRGDIRKVARKQRGGGYYLFYKNQSLYYILYSVLGRICARTFPYNTIL